MGAITRDKSNYSQPVETVINSLGDEMLSVLKEANAIIAGGALLSAFTQEPINDVDVYFKSKEDLTKAFVQLTKDWDSVYLSHTSRSITLKDRDTDTIVQLIHFDFFDNAETIFKAFDFTVCMAAIELAEGIAPTLVMSDRFIVDVASKTLRFNNGTRYPYASLLRVRKYKERGYKIGKGNMLAIAVACSQQPINSWDDAQEQFGGLYGNEIQLQVEEGQEFTAQALHDVTTSICETASFSIPNYEAIFEELTGTTYNRRNELDF